MHNHSSARIVIFATSPAFVRVFLLDQIRFLIAQGYDVHLIVGSGQNTDSIGEELKPRLHSIEIARDVQPLRDAMALWRIIVLLLRIRPAILHTHTPKAGLIGMLASWLIGTPNRVHTIHGLRSETLSGWKLRLISSMEKLTVALATRVLAVSESLRTEVIRRGMASEAQIQVLGYGACAGVDLGKFNAARFAQKSASSRESQNIPQASMQVAYIGRIATDKGLTTLADAWQFVRDREPRAELLIVGPVDPTDPVAPDVLALFHTDDRIRFLPIFTDDAPQLLASSVLAVQPSYREGLGVAALEASAMGIPVVASRVTGLIDAVLDGSTGILVPACNPRALAGAIVTLLADKSMREAMGRNGRQFVAERFDHRAVRKHLDDLYASLPAKGARVKRCMDVAAALLGGFIVLPLVLLTALLVRIRMGSPIFFLQQRAGRGGREFTLYKFRTMHSERERRSVTDESQRIPALGRWLRALSIDELPQLWNVLCGDMSLVGPRPLLVDYLSRYTPQQRRRHEVAPGITGLAQVYGRNAISWEEKFALDVRYVDNRSLLLDLRILLLTVKRVLSMSNITPRDQPMMQEFKGTRTCAESADPYDLSMTHSGEQNAPA